MLKEFKTRAVNGNTHLIELYYEGGGEMPEALDGMYTSKTTAMQAAEVYVRGRRKRKSREEAKAAEA